MKLNRLGSRAIRTTSASISKKVQSSPPRLWQARLPVPSPTAATRANPPRAARTASIASESARRNSST
jgi:hypothetical protein